MNIPAGKRLAVVSMELSEGQIISLQSRAGIKASEALVAGVVDNNVTLRGELEGPEAMRIAAEIWKRNHVFVSALEARPEVNAAFVEHTGHEIERDVPNYLFFR